MIYACFYSKKCFTQIINANDTAEVNLISSTATFQKTERKSHISVFSEQANINQSETSICSPQPHGNQNIKAISPLLPSKQTSTEVNPHLVHRNLTETKTEKPHLRFFRAPSKSPRQKTAALAASRNACPSWGG
jgi:hypothetical protein